MAGVCKGECIGCSLGDEPKILVRCHSCGLSQLYEAFGWNSVCGQADNLKGIKGNIFFFFFLSFVFL